MAHSRLQPVGLLFSKHYVVSGFVRNFATFGKRASKNKEIKLTPEEQEAKDLLNHELSQYMHGRKNRERLDSVTSTILRERAKHQLKLVNYRDQTSVGPKNLSNEDDIAEEANGEDNEHNLDTLASKKLTKADDVSSVQIQMNIQQMVRELLIVGFGQGKQRIAGVYKDLKYWTEDKKTGTAAGGFAQFNGSAIKSPWPVFRHLLPEFAFTGHSNCGKSTLVNAMIGVRPNSQAGLAKAHERAGWTDEIFFYALGKKPPVLTLSDLPGYGHAVASSADMKEWKVMTKSYLSQRIILSRCFVLVDSTRGLCNDDHSMLRFLTKYKIPWQVILTKGDLLDLELLAACKLLVDEELQLKYFPVPEPISAIAVSVANKEGNSPSDVTPTLGKPPNPASVLQFHPCLAISSNTGAGIQDLWRQLSQLAYDSSLGFEGHDDNSTAVREHKLAGRLRARQ